MDCACAVRVAPYVYVPGTAVPDPTGEVMAVGEPRGQSVPTRRDIKAVLCAGSGGLAGIQHRQACIARRSAAACQVNYELF